MTARVEWLREGRCWVFRDDDINTDQIMPRRGFELPPAAQSALVLESVRPGWSGSVRVGDILIAGRRFGCGSSRPAPLLFARIGISVVVAESFGDIFLRNAVAYALPVLECPGVLDCVSEADTVRVDVASGRFDNISSGATLQGAALPALLLETIAAGGVHAMLRRDGYMGAAM